MLGQRRKNPIQRVVIFFILFIISMGYFTLFDPPAQVLTMPETVESVAVSWDGERRVYSGADAAPFRDYLSGLQITRSRRGPDKLTDTLFTLTVTDGEGGTVVYRQYENRFFQTPDDRWYTFNNDQGDQLRVLLGA